LDCTPCGTGPLLLLIIVKKALNKKCNYLLFNENECKRAEGSSSFHFIWHKKQIFLAFHAESFFLTQRRIIFLCVRGIPLSLSLLIHALEERGSSKSSRE
jgi:hypothetical protein